MWLTHPPLTAALRTVLATTEDDTPDAQESAAVCFLDTLRDVGALTTTEHAGAYLEPGENNNATVVFAGGYLDVYEDTQIVLVDRHTEDDL